MTTQYVGNRRLLKLADHLETVAPKYLDMGAWIQKRNSQSWDSSTFYRFDLPEEMRSEIKNVNKAINECGAAACAVGHACGIPSFRRAGLKLVDDHGGGSYGVTFSPSYDGKEGFSAVAEFFGIDRDDAFELFSPGSYADAVRPKTVANAIRRFVAKRQKVAK